MMKILTTATKTSISEVLETMFFLPVEIEAESIFIQSGMEKHKPNMACQLAFTGDCSGRFTLVIPKDLLCEVTENFLGEPRETLEDEHILGTLTEILNMVGGNALSKVDSKIPFELDIPKVIDESKIPESESFVMIKTSYSMMAIHIAVD